MKYLFLILYLIFATSGASAKCKDLVQVGAKKFESIARHAGLIYRTTFGPGYTRSKVKGGYRYFDTKGNVIADAKRLAFIKSLGIPPAWTDVWISPNPDSHVLARGKDDSGRDQRVYHPKWIEATAAYKFNRIIDFGKTLPALRQSVNDDLNNVSSGLSKDRVIAGILRLMHLRPIRVGSQESADVYQHYGATTLRKKHFTKIGTKILNIEFDGKHGVKHDIEVSDAALAKLVNELVDQSGYEVFRYVSANGQKVRVTESDINSYLKSVVGDEHSVKDMRTWAATVKAVELLSEYKNVDDIDQRLTHLNDVFNKVGDHLVNEPEESRRSYIHPEVIEAYEGGTLFSELSSRRVANAEWFSSAELIVLRYFNP